jgi:hypothetical protein
LAGYHLIKEVFCLCGEMPCFARFFVFVQGLFCRFFSVMLMPLPPLIRQAPGVNAPPSCRTQGNFAEAYDLYRQLAIDAGAAEPADIGYAVGCLNNLRPPG